MFFISSRFTVLTRFLRFACPLFRIARIVTNSSGSHRCSSSSGSIQLHPPVGTWWFNTKIISEISGCQNNSHENVHPSVDRIGTREFHNRESNVRVSKAIKVEKVQWLEIMVEDFQKVQHIPGRHSRTIVSISNAWSIKTHIRIKSKLTFQRRQINLANPYRSKWKEILLYLWLNVTRLLKDGKNE